ncbi:MAG: hypothetical protein IPM46_01455 [Flavobacteriales bacterium]|nr:hypothetical protein [Flavobacteriales bacterium]
MVPPLTAIVPVPVSTVPAFRFVVLLWVSDRVAAILIVPVLVSALTMAQFPPVMFQVPELVISGAELVDQTPAPV